MSSNQPAQEKQNNELYLLALGAAVVSILRWGTLASGIVAALATAAFIFLYQTGTLERMAPNIGASLLRLWNLIRNRSKQEEGRLLQPYDLLLGQDVDTGEWVFSNLKKMKSTAVWGVNGTGKTSFLHSIVHFILHHYLESDGAVYGPDQIQLAISDLKDGVDFSIYQNLPHLLCPIVDNVEKTNDLIKVIQNQMTERSRLFKIVSGGSELALCNDLERYHSLKQERGYNSLPTLPRILVIFEEISTFTRKAETLNELILIAEKGRAYGIHLFCCTQYPKKEAIPVPLQEQLNTRIIGRMTKRAYTVAGVYREDWEGRELSVGQWFAGLGNNGSSYRVIQGILYPDDELARVANEASKGHNPPAWPTPKRIERETAVPSTWTGSDDDKRQMLLAWFDDFEECPTADEFATRFGASRRTYFNWVPQLWEEYTGG